MKEEVYLALSIAPEHWQNKDMSFINRKKTLAKRIGISVLKSEQDDLVAKSYANYIIASTKHFRLGGKLDPHHSLQKGLEAIRTMTKVDFGLVRVYHMATLGNVSFVELSIQRGYFGC